MMAASCGTSGDDAPLAQALDSLDQLTLRRDRERRRVTEEENAVRCLEELLAEKQRELEQLSREADSRSSELSALERRVPALEETCRGARCTLKTLIQMRDLLRNQLSSEKRKTEQMLKELDDELEKTAARWKQYEAVYLTMPAYQRKLEMDALLVEERELNENKQRLEMELKSCISDKDFCIRLAEYWTQARLLEGAIGERRGGRQSPDHDNMSGVCSQGFSTPRASHTPSPISDMETSQDLSGGGSQPEPTLVVGRTTAAESPADRARPPPPVSRSGAQVGLSAGGDGGRPTEPDREPVAALSTPQERLAQPSRHEATSTPASTRDEMGPRATPHHMSTLPSPFKLGASPQHQRPSQIQPHIGGRPQPPQQPPVAQQSPTYSRSLSPAQGGPAPQTAPSPENSTGSLAEPREAATSTVRRAGSFLIQMPSLYRPIWPRSGGATEAHPGHRPAAPASPAPVATHTPPPTAVPPPPLPPPPPTLPPTLPPPPPPPTLRPPPPPPPPPPPSQPQPKPPQPQQQQRQPPLASMTQDVEMTDIQEVRQGPVRPQQDGRPRPAAAESSPSKSGERISQGGYQGTNLTSPGRASPARQATEATETCQSQPQPQTAEQCRPIVSEVSGAEREPLTPSAPQGTPRMLAGRQYWLPLPPETPTATTPSVDDERRSFVQQLRQSPELSPARRPSPASRPAWSAPAESGREQQFLRPAVPSPRRTAPAPAGSPRSIFDTPRRPVVEPQQPAVGGTGRDPPQPTPPSTPRPAPPATPSEPATPARPVAAAGDTPRSMAAIFASPETDVGQLDSSFSLFGGPAAKEASPQLPPPSSMSLFGAGDVGGDGDQGTEDFSFSFFGGGSRATDKDTSGGGGGGVFSFF